MDYFGDKGTDLGNQGVFSQKTVFPSIEDNPIQIVERERTYKKDKIVQEDVVEGFNRAIKAKDQDGNTRLLLGFKEDAF
jgi:hypothetical protein